MSLATDLRSAWSIAATTPLGSGLRAIPLGVSGRRVWATVGDRGHRGLLVELQPNEIVGGTIKMVARTSTALVAELYSFSDNGPSIRGLHITLTMDDLLEAFTGFCEPLVARFAAEEPVHLAFQACFAEFQRLISGLPDSTIPTSIVGLLGELLILSELVSLDTSATKYWAYPSLERHDFRNGLVALEVKTTLRAQQSRDIITINSIDQLDPPSQGGVLYLHWLRLERNAAGSISIRNVLDRIFAAVPATVFSRIKRTLDDQLDLGGFDHAAFSLYDRVTFCVDDAFPKLTTARLIAGRPDPGIGGVHYQVDLAMATSHRCAPRTANEALLAGATQ